MTHSFSPNEVISDPSFLHGREKDLEIIVNTIKSGTNRQVQGERRFGKTCFLNCTKSILDRDESFVTLYLDCKKLSRFKGTSNFYRFLIALVVSEVSKKKLLDCHHKIKNFSIGPNLDYEDTYEQLLDINDFRVESIFEEIIPYYSDLFDLKFVFLFDDYEYLMTTLLDNTQGFMLLRALSDLPRQKGVKPLTYIISGSWSWLKMCRLTGSPELNNQGASVLYLGSIEFLEFTNMIQNASNNLSFPIKTKTLFDYSGGVPFYAKKIIQTIELGKEMDNFTILNEEFATVINNLEPNEKQLLLSIIKKKSGNRSLSDTLVLRGLLKNNGSKFSINGYYFQEYIINNCKENNQISEILVDLVDNVFEIIEIVNQNFKNNRLGSYLFEPITDEHTMRNQFRKVCEDGDDFQVFVNSVYRCVFERTAEHGKNLFRIPGNLKSHDFKKHIDSFRQIHIHQSSSKEFHPSSNQLKREELYKIYLGKVNEPRGIEFYSIQRKLLDNFINFLKDIENNI